MRGLAYNPGILPAEMIIRQRVKPMPSREELLKRNSFPSVNQNKYLNAMLLNWKKRYAISRRYLKPQKSATQNYKARMHTSATGTKNWTY